LYKLGVQGVKVLILLGAFLLPSVAPVFQQIFDLRSSHCLLLHSICHLGSSPIFSYINFATLDFLCLVIV
jgi:hypothetical protein